MRQWVHESADLPPCSVGMWKWTRAGGWGERGDVARSFLWSEAPWSSLGWYQACVGPGAVVLLPKPELKRATDEQVSAPRSSKVLCISRKTRNRWSGSLPWTPPVCPPHAHTCKRTPTLSFPSPPPTAVRGPDGLGPVLPELRVTHRTVTALISIQKGREELC